MGARIGLAAKAALLKAGGEGTRESAWSTDRATV
jgi:hypothetical protein